MKFTVTRVVEVEMYHIKLGLAWIAIMKNAMVICVVAAGIKLYKLGPCMEILVNAFTIGLLRAVTVYVMPIGLCRAVMENIPAFGLLRALMEYVMTIGLFWHRSTS